MHDPYRGERAFAAGMWSGVRTPLFVLGLFALVIVLLFGPAALEALVAVELMRDLR